MLDIQKLRSEFPILESNIHGDKPLIYFDNGASVQKPKGVIERLEQFYFKEYANIHRGVHYLSDLSTNNYENSRLSIQKLINAKHSHEVIFTSGTTSGINLIANGITALRNTGRNELLITYMEHHSNIVPWQILAEKEGLKLKVIPIDKSGVLILDHLENYLNENTLLFSFTHISNSLGTINPVIDLIKAAQDCGVYTLLDAAQSVQHIPLDVQALNCDFMVFSGHKMYGPTGTGVLYGKENLLDQIPPYQGGGDMIDSVTFEKTTYNSLPFKFEAGTPNIAGGIALNSAVEFLTEYNIKDIAIHEAKLLDYATEAVSQIPNLKIVGQADDKSSVLSFNIEGLHPFDVGTLLDTYGIAIRTGHHCTQPIMDFFNIPGTCRASFAAYNTTEEIDVFVEKLQKVVKLLS